MPPSLLDPSALAELFDAAWAAPAGDIVEVGVYRGGSAVVLHGVAKARGYTLWLYDTFTGIPYADPDKGDTHQVGDFSDTSPDEVGRACPGAVVTVGTFPDTLGPEPSRVALAHIDCDQYAAIYGALDALAPRMVSGGVIILDDYGHLAGATRAVNAWLLDGKHTRTLTVSLAGKARVTF